MYVTMVFITAVKKAVYTREEDRVPREILIAMGGWSSQGLGPCKLIEAYDCLNAKWVSQHFQLPESKAYHGIQIIKDKVILFFKVYMNIRWKPHNNNLLFSPAYLNYLEYSS